MPDSRRPTGSGLLPIVAVCVVLGIVLAGWWLFPMVHTALSRQDCIASGRVTGC